MILVIIEHIIHSVHVVTLIRIEKLINQIINTDCTF